MDTTTNTPALLIVLAHPDDESFAMGGTLAKYAAQGVKVTLVCATRGEAGIAGLTPDETAQVRTRELEAAATALGLADVRFLGYLDGQLATANPTTVVGQLVDILRAVQPQAVITFGPDGISGHPDHRAIHRFATTAFDQAGLLARLYYLAPSEATMQGCGVIPAEEIAGGPVAAIDVGEHLATKVRAMQCHASQNPPFSGSPEVEAERLACHEYFTLARPIAVDGTGWTDLFEPALATQNYEDIMPTDYVAYHHHLEERLTQLGREVSGPMTGFARLHKKAVEAGVLDAKTKELMALAIGIAVHCDGCIAYHTHDAVAAGASRAELLETIGVALMMGGGPASIYAAHTLDAIDQFLPASC